MAVYKVPQDVEADDKLIGPFSFRQFIYLVIVAMAGAIAWGLSQIFLPLAVIPLPVILFFGALALPLKKDQPMEIYLAAVVSFYLKPRKRIWDADGTQTLVEITAPKTVEPQRTKGISESEASRRLSYLAQIADTGGWAVRGVTAAPEPNTAMNADLYFEAQQTNDILDDNSGVGQSFGNKLAAADQQRKQDLMQRIQQPQATQPAAPASIPQPTQQSPQYDPYVNLQSSATPQPATQSDTPLPPISYNPYPEAMRQSVIEPINPQPTAPQTQASTTTSVNEVSPDIISLASNSDLSIETIAHEAERIKQKEAKQRGDNEVVISLR